MQRVLQFGRRALGYARRRRWEFLQRRLVLRTKPIRLPATGTGEIRTLCGHSRTYQAIGSIKSLLRFLPTPVPVIIHDDGSLEADDLRAFETHLPGMRVVPRPEADARVEHELRARDLHRCIALRRRYVYSMKLFDLQLYADGARVLYMDTDVLFHATPHELLASFLAPDDHWEERFNEDFQQSYTWSPEQIERHTGVRVPPKLNSGLLTWQRPELPWALYEDCLTMPHRPDEIGAPSYLVEQTLAAIDLASRGGRVLPPEYDVGLRQFWAGLPVISEHYCGGNHRSIVYYEHFTSRVGPALLASGGHAPIASPSLVMRSASRQ